MRIPVATLFVALVWVLASGGPSLANIVLGLALSVGVLTLLRARPDVHLSLRSLTRAVPFLFHYTKDFFHACLQVGLQVLRPLHRLRPAVIEVPIDVRGDAEIALLANLLSYSPGTLCLEVSEEGRSMFIHVMSLQDPQELERHVREDLEAHVLRVMR